MWGVCLWSSDCLKTGVEVLQEQQAKRGRDGTVQRPDPGWKQREGALPPGVQRYPAEGRLPQGFKWPDLGERACDLYTREMQGLFKMKEARLERRYLSTFFAYILSDFSCNSLTHAF